MSASVSQVLANQANAQHSTGPKTEAGKAASSRNNFRHGLTGLFRIKVLPWEKTEDYEHLLNVLHDEHQPATITESLLVAKMAQHLWLAQRALQMQDLTLNPKTAECFDEKEFQLAVRYQTTHDRAFHKCLNELLKLRAEKRKAEAHEAALSKRAEDSRNGFESQKRNEAGEVRKQEMHEARLRFINAQTRTREVDNEIRHTCEAPLPGHMRLDFDVLRDFFCSAVHHVNRETLAKAQAEAA